MDITGTFEEFLSNYTVAKNGIEDKIAKFNAGETLTYGGFEEINKALTKAMKTSHELYGDNGASLDSDLDGWVTYLKAEVGCIQAETYLLNESDPIKSTLKRKSSINTASKLDKGTRRNLKVQLKQTSQILSLCDNSLKKTLFLYANTNLARKFYVNKNKFPGLFHKEDSLPIIFHYMYPKGNSVEAHYKIGMRLVEGKHCQLAVNAFEDSIKLFNIIEESDKYYNRKKDFATKSKQELKKDELVQIKLLMESKEQF